jgi:hypothetical protein
MKMLTSSLPLNLRWIHKVFQTCQVNRSFKAERAMTDALIERISATEWETTGSLGIKPRIFGFMGREDGVDRSFDRGLGLVVEMEPFRKATWERNIERTWNFDYYARTYAECPVHHLSEMPVRVTNPVVAWLDIQNGCGDFGRLTVRQIVVEGFESAISIVSGHSALVDFE